LWGSQLLGEELLKGIDVSQPHLPVVHLGGQLLLQRNVLDRRRWTSRDELRVAIVTWIERTYHR
jgi:hypothetical protein